MRLVVATIGFLALAACQPEADAPAEENIRIFVDVNGDTTVNGKKLTEEERDAFMAKLAAEAEKPDQ